MNILRKSLSRPVRHLPFRSLRFFIVFVLLAVWLIGSSDIPAANAQGPDIPAPPPAPPDTGPLDSAWHWWSSQITTPNSFVNNQLNLHLFNRAMFQVGRATTDSGHLFEPQDWHWWSSMAADPDSFANESPYWGLTSQWSFQGGRGFSPGGQLFDSSKDKLSNIELTFRFLGDTFLSPMGRSPIFGISGADLGSHAYDFLTTTIGTDIINNRWLDVPVDSLNHVAPVRPNHGMNFFRNSGLGVTDKIPFGSSFNYQPLPVLPSNQISPNINNWSAANIHDIDSTPLFVEPLKAPLPEYPDIWSTTDFGSGISSWVNSSKDEVDLVPELAPVEPLTPPIQLPDIPAGTSKFDTYELDHFSSSLGDWGSSNSFDLNTFDSYRGGWNNINSFDLDSFGTGIDSLNFMLP